MQEPRSSQSPGLSLPLFPLECGGGWSLAAAGGRAVCAGGGGGFKLILCIKMLFKFCQILIEVLLKYNAKQEYIHKVLKKSKGIFVGAKLSFLTPLSVVHRVGVQ